MILIDRSLLFNIIHNKIMELMKIIILYSNRLDYSKVKILFKIEFEILSRIFKSYNGSRKRSRIYTIEEIRDLPPYSLK